MAAVLDASVLIDIKFYRRDSTAGGERVIFSERAENNLASSKTRKTRGQDRCFRVQT